jgi:hypothetical protein
MTRKPSIQDSTLNVLALFVACVTLLAAAAPPARQSRATQPSAEQTPVAPAATVYRHSAAEPRSRTRKAIVTADSQSISFLPPVTYSTGATDPYSVAIADVNGDGNPDLIVANQGGSNGDGSVAVLLGNGDGTFRTPTDYDSGGVYAYSVAVADVNGDGKPDIIVGNGCASGTSGINCSAEGVVSVLLGNGNGTFQPAVSYNSGGYSIYGSSVAIADLRGNGKLDIVVANFNASNVGVLLGNGDGTFNAAVTYSSGGSDATSVAIADLNGDGKPDVVVTSFCTVTGCGNNFPFPHGIVGVLLGNGNGTFQPVVTYDPGDGGTFDVAIADVNGDGKPDLVSANCGFYACAPERPGEVGIMLGNGDGTFQTAVLYPAANSPDSIAVADMNGDGIADVVVGNWGTSSDGNFGAISVLPGNGDGTFQLPLTFSTGGAEVPSIAVADLNSDGKPDVVAVGIAINPSPGVVSVLINNSCTGNCSTTTLTSSLNPTTYGQSVTFTATVTGTSSVPPTGTVVFQWNDRGETLTLGSATLNSSGIATLTKSSLNADTYPVTAVYKGDANNLGSTSSVVNQVVQQTTSAATLTSSPNPSTISESVKFTATITSPTVKATGPVIFTAGDTVLGTAQIGWNGEAIISTSSLPAGSNTIIATYNGDSNIKGSSASVTQVVTQSPSQLQSNARHAHPEAGCSTQTTLTSSGSPSPVGAFVTFTASVNAPYYCQGIYQSCGSLGSVAFYDIDNLMGTVPIGNNCTAVLQSQLFHLGNNRIKAQYQGSDFDLPSSAVITQVVNAYPTATTLSSSLNPSIYGQSLTWTATVTSPDTNYEPPTGQVAFMAYGEAIGHATLNSSTGVATFTSSVEYANSYPLTAVYKGDAYNQSSTSSVLNQVINPTTTTATLTSSPNPSTSGEAVTFKATINSPTTSPTGPVTFTAGNTVLGNVQLKGRVAELTTSSLPVGSTTVTVTYLGDSNIQGSSASVTQVVTQ